MGLALGCFGTANPARLKGVSSVLPHRYVQDFYIGKLGQNSIFLSLASLLRKDFYTGQSRITAMGSVFGCLDGSKPSKPKAYLSRFDRTATYKIFTLAGLGFQR
jgi:hypothetical protein